VLGSYINNMSARLSIIIPVYNSAPYTKACLTDLSYLPPGVEIVVVDNGSTDETPDIIKELNLPNIKYERLERNFGFAGGCNWGYLISSGKYVMFLNNDIRVRGDKTNWIDKCLEKADTHLVGPALGILDLNFNFASEVEDFPKYKCHTYISGWCLTSSREIFDKLIIPPYTGPFTEEFGKAYFEDSDLSLRAAELNIPLEIVKIPVVHFGKTTSKKLNTLSLYMPAKRKFIEKWKTRVPKK